MEQMGAQVGRKRAGKAREGGGVDVRTGAASMHSPRDWGFLCFPSDTWGKGPEWGTDLLVDTQHTGTARVEALTAPDFLCLLLPILPHRPCPGPCCSGYPNSPSVAPALSCTLPEG